MVTFRQFITEERGARGEQAEIRLYNILKKYNKLPPDQSKPAGFSAHDVDLSFLDKEDNTHLLEVKYDLPDFGQFELKWEPKRKWHFIDYKPTDPVKAEKANIINQLRKVGVEEEINRLWTDAPRLYSKPQMTFADRKYDAKTFTDHYFDVDPSFIGRYYNSKGVNYIIIDSSSDKYGLYHFGKDPARTKCKNFEPGKTQLRVRIKSRKSAVPNGYGFLGALKIANLPKSNVNLYNPKDVEKILGGYKSR
jgi:hypothetical protein